MKKIIFILFGAILLICHNHTLCRGQQPKHPVVKVGVLAYADMDLQDFAGPLNVFVKAQQATFGQYEIFIIGIDDQPVKTESEVVQISPQYSIDDAPQLDVLIIPGADIGTIKELNENKDFLKGMMTLARKTTIVMTVSTGSYLLAESNLLNNISSTTHFFVADDFQKEFPSTKVVKNVRFVEEGKIITASGGVSGIDGALYLVKKYSGNEVAELIGKVLQYDANQKHKWPVIKDQNKKLKAN